MNEIDDGIMLVEKSDLELLCWQDEHHEEHDMSPEEDD